MKLYRHNENQKLYTIEHLVKDIHHLNNNAFAGIYCIPHQWEGDIIKLTNNNLIDCNRFVVDTFTIVSEL